jgi:glutamate dehydrogenase
MAYKFEKGKDLIVDHIVEKLQEKMSGPQASLCSEFARQFYMTMSLEDLQAWSAEDLAVSAINFWSLIQHRAPHETKIRIYNPSYERHEWQTSHTVVEIITEDMPFLVDSLRMVVERLGLDAHLIIHMGGFCVKRDKNHEVTKILPRVLDNVKPASTFLEAPIFIEIDKQTDPTVLDNLHKNFEQVLEDNRAIVHDWDKMREKVRESIADLEKAPAVLNPNEVEESKAFLRWIEDHHFTFLGVRDYELVHRGKETLLHPLTETGLGLLRSNHHEAHEIVISAMTKEARDLTFSKDSILVTFKTDTEASVHRRAYTDYIGIKYFNEKGEVIGERRIIGLYTSAAYNTNPKHIPFLRHKVASVMKNSNLNPRAHAGKILLNILETLPRDDLIQASEDELLKIAMGIYYMQERRRIRMFARVDIYNRFISCLVYVPKDRFNTDLRQVMQDILKDSFQAEKITFSTMFSESVLARIHYMIKINPENKTKWDFKEIEQKLIEAGHSWTEDLQYFLVETFGEESANQLYLRYKTAFPAAYTDTYNPRSAVYDVKYMESLSIENPLIINLYKGLDDGENHFRLKMYQHENPLPLSDVMPIIEHLGMRAITEKTYVLKFADGTVTWINDFTLHYTGKDVLEIDDIRKLFQTAFINIWFGRAENDRFNQLILTARVSWRQVAILRTYAKYFKQIGMTFSQEYIESALCNNSSIAKQLIELFEIHFDPEENKERTQQFDQKVKDLLQALDNVSNLDEDKIIRQYIHVIAASLRTNYYQLDSEGKPKPYISIKFDSNLIPNLPKPVPFREIFVYSPRMEGIHLRGGKVARGGLRWSDRKEDFRTEVLGLMKAQQVKNAVIVPAGAKGGFVPKHLPTNGSRESIAAEGIACYEQFICGLLDITDNYQEGVIVKPKDGVCYDDDDPYLVVAADKGTATFSDTANAISAKYHFWLGDAFASGGSQGYDHKKMGITARGAWESVKRHFYEKNMDINQDFTVIGIGDMAGDVFGNGMLLSRHIRLVAAFNHIHIFIDPNPDAEASFVERDRLFHLPRSNWTDYNPKLISKGGGVFNRSAKSITVTKEIKELLNITQSEIEPNELIRMILKAEVDLLWSGGIGTFVKGTKETNTDVGDKTNDNIRINSDELRCKIVGEGGNLGLTQMARVEYALSGGYIYTDFIDNSAGVNCSDKEVNIKILLDNVVASGDLTMKQRNSLLSEMTDEIAAQVLKNNFAQTRSISFTSRQAMRSFELNARYLNALESSGKLDRALEFLPDNKTLMERKMMGKGLGRPGISVLQSYSKILLKERILETNVPEDNFVEGILVNYFPKPLQERFRKQMSDHPLKREIIATELSNIIINEMGFNFIFRMQDETGAPVSAIARAYMIAREILDMESLWLEIEGLEGLISAEVEAELRLPCVRLIRRVTRWFLRNQRSRLDVDKSIKLFKPGIIELKKALPDILGPENKEQYERHFDAYIRTGMSKKLAHELAVTRALFAILDIIEVAKQFDIKVTKTAQLYFGIGEFLDLSWIRGQIIVHPTENHWESLSREALRDDLDWQQRQLTAGIIRLDTKKSDFMVFLNEWAEVHAPLIERWQQMLADLRAIDGLNYTMFFVAIRELLDLTQTTVQMSEK